MMEAHLTATEASGPTDATVLAAHWDQQIRDSRKTGDISLILGTAQAAVGALENSVGSPPFAAAQEEALRTLRRITYNCAADAYPGWEIDTPKRSAKDLAAAAALARKSLQLVALLLEDAEKHGHAVWLIGALALAQGDRAAAANSFRSAAEFFGQANAPLLAALAEGYAGIANNDAAAYDKAVEHIAALQDEDGEAIIDQLRIAGKIYGP